MATTQRAIDLVKGKIVLVGHSWGGMVITQAGNDPKVVGLVYLAAYGPDSGESLSAVSANAPQTELTKYLVPSGGYVFISEEGVKTVFANELSPKQLALVMQHRPRPRIPYLTIKAENLPGSTSQPGTS